MNGAMKRPPHREELSCGGGGLGWVGGREGKKPGTEDSVVSLCVKPGAALPSSAGPYTARLTPLKGYMFFGQLRFPQGKFLRILAQFQTGLERLHPSARHVSTPCTGWTLR